VNSDVPLLVCRFNLEKNEIQSIPGNNMEELTVWPAVLLYYVPVCKFV